MIAVPAENGIGNAQHTPVDGEVTAVRDHCIEIRNVSDKGGRMLPEPGRCLY
jgi:hypothetical protein